MPSLLGNGEGFGRLFILSAPAGTGKTTLIHLLTQEFSEVIASISYTTRALRGEEQNGIDYHFITELEFQKKIVAGDFIEYVRLYDSYYGTSQSWIQEKLASGKNIFLVIDTQGARQLKGNIPAVFIFVRPPSLAILRKRLTARQTESSEMIEKRLECAQKELMAATAYDYEIVNDDLQVAYQVLRSIVIAECHRLR